MLNYWQTLWSSLDWHWQLSDVLAAVTWLVWLVIVWPKDDVYQLKGNAGLRQRLWRGTLVIFGLWALDASIHPQLHLHFLALTTCMLMFGWRLATFALIIPSLMFSLLVLEQPWQFFAYSLVGVCLPLWFSFVLYHRCFHLLPHHLFIYIFCGAFLNSALTILVHMLLWSGWLLLSSDIPLSDIIDNYLLVAPLLMFPEALLNGMVITLIVVYRPQWLYDYSDRTYLWQK